MIYKVDPSLPLSEKISLVNDMTIEANGKTAQGTFDVNELDQIYADTGLNRKFLRNQILGNTHLNYTNWTHYYAESGYSIWSIAPTNYKYNSKNQLYMDDKLLVNRGEATALNSSFDKVFDYTNSIYQDDTIDAVSGLTSFSIISGIGDYQYLGSSSIFKGVDYTFDVTGIGYSLELEYWNGTSWINLSNNDIHDSTDNLQTDGMITWETPGDWDSCIVNNSSRMYYIRISTITEPVQTVYAITIKPTTNIRGLLSLSSDDAIQEEWAWCSFNNTIYVTIRNTGQSAYEGSYYIKSASTVANLQNFFVHNHLFKADFENASFNGASINIESGVSFGDLVYVSDQYTFNAADADIWRKRCMGILVAPGYVKMTDGLIQNANTVGSANIVPGDVLYLSQTPGKVSRTAPPLGGGRIQQRVGIAIAYETSGNVVDMIFRPEYV